MITWRPAVRWVLAVATFSVAFAFSFGPDALRMTMPAALAVSSMAALAVWLSGGRPLAALVAAVAMTAALPLIGSTFQAMALVLVLVGFQASMLTDAPRRLLTAVVLVALVGNEVWVRIAFDRGFDDPAVLTPVLYAILAVGLGSQARLIRLQHAELIALQDVDHRRAVSDERRRIARDIHDVAAHHLTALVVHNTLARRLDTREALTHAADFTAETAGATLDSLRQVVHVLGAADGAAPLRPQPTLADLDDTVERVRAAGLQVERHTTGDIAMSQTAEVAVVRIAQEALANVLRHRGPGRAWLQLRKTAGGVELIVEDDGPTPAVRLDTAGGEVVTDGRGLIGMRERAAACGGRVAAGPTGRGGWQVQALLPADCA